jgi:hypothetical protein
MDILTGFWFEVPVRPEKCRDSTSRQILGQSLQTNNIGTVPPDKCRGSTSRQISGQSLQSNVGTVPTDKYRDSPSRQMSRQYLQTNVGIIPLDKCGDSTARQMSGQSLETNAGRVPPDKCRENVLIRSQPPLSRLLAIHYLPVTLPLSLYGLDLDYNSKVVLNRVSPEP